jgi:toxin-antitoxin system PIN domain toxin
VFVLDTNILVYAADRDSPHHELCQRLVRESRERASAWYVTWGICYEFLRVVTHPRVFRRPWSSGEAWAFVDAVLAAPSLGVLLPGDRHREVAAQVLAELPHLAGNLMHDVHTAVLMREHGVRVIYTRDTDFHRFPFLELVDPVALHP